MTPTPTLHRLTSIGLGVALTIAALTYAGYNAWIGLAPDDSENLETTRVLAAARQFTDGPGALYGPFSGANPCVLIQAPLYYRLTALLAWPLVIAGIDPVPACFASGRLISFLSFLAALLMIARLARLDGAPARVGYWAALIAAGTPLVGSYPVTMRPDMLGVAMQTAGLVLVVRSLNAPAIPRRVRCADPPNDRRRDRSAKRTLPDAPADADRPRLVLAYVAFAFAFGVKQHYIVVPAIASLSLFALAARRLVPVRPVLVAHAAALLLVGSLLGVEQYLTSGMFLRSAFAVPKDLETVTAGSWEFVGLVAGTALRRGVGLVALAVACLLAATRRNAGSRLDAILGLVIVGELALMTKLCLNSSGGWTNYALQSALLGSVLLARALDRLLADDRPAWRLVPVGLAALALIAADFRTVAIGVAARRELRADLRAILDAPAVADRPAEQIYFAGGLQPFNRRLGRRDLAHDEWLYGAFEAVREAEPRRDWLQPALADGPVRVVVVPADASRPAGTVAGLSAPLPDLGYRLADRLGRFDVWERR